MTRSAPRFASTTRRPRHRAAAAQASRSDGHRCMRGLCVTANLARPCRSWVNRVEDDRGERTQLVRNTLPAQPVDATQALNFSAGVSNPRVLRGRSLSWRATLFRWACEYTDKSAPFGKYCLNRPFVFSFEPRCHGLFGSLTLTTILVSHLIPLSSAPSSQ